MTNTPREGDLSFVEPDGFSKADKSLKYGEIPREWEEHNSIRQVLAARNDDESKYKVLNAIVNGRMREAREEERERVRKLVEGKKITGKILAHEVRDHSWESGYNAALSDIITALNEKT